MARLPFTPARIEGGLILSDVGDLWERLPDPSTLDGSMWSYHGRIEHVPPSAVPKRHRASLERLKLPSAVAAQHATT